LVSSANKKISDFVITLDKSLIIKILKRKIEKWLHWETPDGTLNLES